MPVLSASAVAILSAQSAPCTRPAKNITSSRKPSHPSLVLTQHCPFPVKTLTLQIPIVYTPVSSPVCDEFRECVRWISAWGGPVSFAE